ncbi:alkylglycerol monooxygenase-like, partial [Paramuricea clavata]
ISHYSCMIQTFWTTPGISNKFFVLFNGPSWSPGKPRLGDGTGEEIEYPVIKYDKTLPLPITLYVIGHFLLLLFVYYKHLEISQSCSVFQTIGVIAYLLFALTTFGSLFDHKWYGPIIEGLRCIAYFIMDSSSNKYEWKQNHESEKAVNTATCGFIHSIFIMSLTMCFIVETMKINWTGNESTYHKDDIKYRGGKQSFKHDGNMNTIPNTDMIYLRYTK